LNEYWQKIKRQIITLLSPKLAVDNIHAIDFTKLKDQGINCLIMDLDDTLLPRTVNDITPQLFEWIATRKEEGFKICLASNSRHPLRVKYIGETLGVPYISMGFKPLPFVFWKSLEILESSSKETAMIGDQLFMDVLGGNIVNLFTIYVKNLTPENFPPRIWMRQLERWILDQTL